MGCADVAAVLLAAGQGTRFGGNKLEAMLDGKMLGLHAAHTVSRMECGHLFAVHDPAHTLLAKALHDEGFTLVDNHDPAAGQAHSLGAAVHQAMHTDAAAIIVCLADMPFVRLPHLSALLAVSQANPDRVIASVAGTTLSPPAIFPRSMWPDLLALKGDAGARMLLRQAIHVGATAQELSDIDTPETLAASQSLFIESR